MKINRNGKSSIFTIAEYTRAREFIVNQKFRMLFDLAWYSGERWGALVQLKTSDVYDLDRGSGRYKTREIITFRASTRKGRADGTRETRQIPMHPVLHQMLKEYSKNIKSEWMFPRELDTSFHISLRSADKFLRDALEKAGFANRGFSTHSTRRSFITRLYEKGTDIYTIKQITGHRNINTLLGYIEASPNRIKGAIDSL